MRERVYLFALLLSAVGAVTSPVVASEGDEARFGVSLGLFDYDDFDEVLELGVDYTWGPRFGAWALRPMIGAAATEDEGFYVYAGVRHDLELGRLVLSPSFAISLYEDGDGKDLGGPIEFRSGLDVSIAVGKGRVGVGFYHLSNAGLYEPNPGSNHLLLRIQWP